MAGESSTGVQKETFDGLEVVESHCMVKFRPRKNWYGEYGFDWVREGRDDYEEKIALETLGNSDLAFYHSYDYYKDQMTFEQYDEKAMQYHVDGAYRIPPHIAASMLRKYKGDDEYEKWREEQRRDLMGTSETQSDGIAMDDDREKAALEALVDKRAADEIVKNPDIYDNYAWQTDDQIAQNEDLEKFDDALAPMEYFIVPELVVNAKYNMSSRRYPGVWNSEVEYDDFANGTKESQTAVFQLDHFVQNTNGKKMSMEKKNGSYVVPYYSYGQGITVGTSNQTYQITKTKKDGKFEVVDRQHLDGVIKLARRGYFDDDIHKIRIYSQNYWPSSLYDYPETKLLASYTKISYSVGNNATVVLTFRKVNGVLSMVAELRVFGTLWKLYYENGRLLEIRKNTWMEISRLSSSEQMEIQRKADKYIFQVIGEDDMTDVVAVMAKVKAKEIDNVEVVLAYPQEYKEFQIPLGEISQDTNTGRDLWNNQPVYSWKESYENTFTPFYIRYITNDGEKKELKKYCVPVLSISHNNSIKRTHFIYNTFLDAPKTSDEPDGEYELQVLYEGKCDKLCFKVDKPDSIKIEPAEIEPPEKENTIKVKYTGKYDTPVTIDVKAVTKHSDKADDVELAGRLKIRINDIKDELRIISAIVKIGGAPPSEKLMDCIKDQMSSMDNSLSQIGLKTDIVTVSINVDSALLDLFLEDGSLKYDEWVFVQRFNSYMGLGDLLMRLLFEKFGKDIIPLLVSSVCFFFIDKGFKRITAYQGESDGCKYEVFGNSIGFRRGRTYVLAHETGHALNLPHSFQLHHVKGDQAFCLPVKRTSNVMDYSGLLYSLHKYQWDTMIDGMAKFKSTYMNDPRVKKSLRKK